METVYELRVGDRMRITAELLRQFLDRGGQSPVVFLKEIRLEDDQTKTLIVDRLPEITLRPVDISNPIEVGYLDRLVQQDAQYFEFKPPLDWAAQGPDQWCYAAVDDGAVVIGFGRLSVQPDLGSLVCSYGVEPLNRRRGCATQIVRLLQRIAAARDLPLLAGVIPANEPSLALCRKIFGEPLWTSPNATGQDIVVFGDARARGKLHPAVEYGELDRKEAKA